MTVLEAGATEIFFCTLKLLCNRGCLLWFSSSLHGNVVWSQKYVFVEFEFGASNRMCKVIVFLFCFLVFCCMFLCIFIYCL